MRWGYVLPLRTEGVRVIRSPRPYAWHECGGPCLDSGLHPLRVQEFEGGNLLLRLKMEW